MWKREEAAKPVVPPPAASGSAGSMESRPAGASALVREVVTIGKSVLIKGELSGSEDLTIEGQVEGKIELKQHVLTVGPHGRIRAEVLAKIVVVLGEVLGKIQASEKVAILDSGSVEGDIKAPKVAIAEGARFRGAVDMQQGASATEAAKPEAERERPRPPAAGEMSQPAPVAVGPS